EPGTAHGGADRRRDRGVAPERPARVGADRRHALVAGAAGVRVRRPADLGLLGILELAALGDRQKVEPRARELDTEPRRVLDAVAALDHVIAEIAAAEDGLVTDPLAHGLDHLEGQPDPVRALAAIAIVPRVE